MVLDEIRIWKRETNPSVPGEAPKFFVSADSPDLMHLWNFNEGYGDVAHDLVGDIDFIFPAEMMPLWNISHGSQPLDVGLPLEYPDFKNRTLAELALEKCSAIFKVGEFHDSCADVGESIFSIHFTQCLEDIRIQVDVTASVEAAISIAELCYQEHGSKRDWPDDFFCGEFGEREIPSWMVKKCDSNKSDKTKSSSGSGEKSKSKENGGEDGSDDAGGSAAEQTDGDDCIETTKKPKGRRKREEVAVEGYENVNAALTQTFVAVVVAVCCLITVSICFLIKRHKVDYLTNLTDRP